MMASQPESNVDRIHRLVKAFNGAVESSIAYRERKSATTTPTLFFDYDGDKLPPLAPAPNEWCKISIELETQLCQYRGAAPIAEYSADREARLLRSKEFMDACRAEVPKYFVMLACLYLKCFHTLADTYDPDVKERVKAKALSLTNDFDSNRVNVNSYLSIVEYIKQQINKAKEAGPKRPPPVRHKLTRAELTEKVLKLVDERIHSIKDICAICRISQYKYYAIIKEHKRRQRGIEEANRGPGAKSRLGKEHLEFIKKLADAPHKSYTVPEIRDALLSTFNIDVGRKAVHYQLTEKLDYSYKRNHFKYPTAFSRGQFVVRYKVCKSLLEYMKQGKNIICIDESGFHTGIQKEYSYAKKGLHPFRFSRMSAKRLNIVMAVSNQCVLAYQGRELGHNEHTFCAFIIDLAAKIISMGPDSVNNTVLFMDNAAFHKSSLPRKLFELLPFPVFFNAVAWSDLNPIETVFAMLKAKIKEFNAVSMYFSKFLTLFRTVLYERMHAVIKSLGKEKLFKCYMRVFYFVEKGIRGVIKNEDMQQQPAQPANIEENA
ncbi:MAG: transposase [Puia sp.]|nr:transposase [Puia sp.]